MSDLIYNSGLVRPSSGGQLLVDSATLISLAKADQLNLLLQTGREVVITSTIQREAVSDTNYQYYGITVTVLDCTPEVRHDNYSDRHFEDDLWQQEERTVSFRPLAN